MMKMKLLIVFIAIVVFHQSLLCQSATLGAWLHLLSLPGKYFQNQAPRTAHPLSSLDLQSQSQPHRLSITRSYKLANANSMKIIRAVPSKSRILESLRARNPDLVNFKAMQMAAELKTKSNSTSFLA